MWHAIQWKCSKNIPTISHHIYIYIVWYALDFKKFVILLNFVCITREKHIPASTVERWQTTKNETIFSHTWWLNLYTDEAPWSVTRSMLLDNSSSTSTQHIYRTFLSLFAFALFVFDTFDESSEICQYLSYLLIW